ncbi:MAG TPA: HD domain-containing phosphohydrolase [Acidimicrobiales bacterium]|nr:HD domain-containing phosphohydrolase [Acidimicrobiales bacterium]
MSPSGTASSVHPGRRRGPALLALVFGVFLAIIGITATAQTVLVSSHLSTAALDSVVGDDTALVRVLVNGTLTPDDLTATGVTPARLATVEAKLAAVVVQGGMLRAEVRTPDGRLLFASDGRPLPVVSTTDFAKAAAGSAAASILPASSSTFGTAQLLSEALPIISGGQVRAVFVVDRDAAPILQGIENTRQEIVIVTLSAALIVAFILYLIFRSAQGRLTRQTRALLDATRRDALTDMLNHGALVTELARQVENARQSGSSVEIALIDIDSFRLLNDTHGHDAGDRALLEVSRHLTRCAPEGSTVGRYGPDEFLVIAIQSVIAGLEPALERLRAQLADVDLQFDGTDRLPLTVSGGVCTYPLDADSVTSLLSVGAMTVADAKASGGDAIRVAHALGAKPAFTKTFDILQGLVIAVDTKDRYTKRHSEDVARYADFIADRLDIEPELRRAIHISGLLHDVGKIGIPDSILRKPAKLTAEEYAAFQQHVALGDMIVRDLPTNDLVRAGVRYHHERWDGRGYLEALAGQDIPLIGRILAVADAFSAMTTTRPYRKALSVQEAIRRLEDAAGSQLEDRLVRVFVDGLQSAEQPPLPDATTWRAKIWTSADQVA